MLLPHTAEEVLALGWHRRDYAFIDTYALSQLALSLFADCIDDPVSLLSELYRYAFQHFCHTPPEAYYDDEAYAQLYDLAAILLPNEAADTVVSRLAHWFRSFYPYVTAAGLRLPVVHLDHYHERYYSQYYFQALDGYDCVLWSLASELYPAS